MSENENCAELQKLLRSACHNVVPFGREHFVVVERPRWDKPLNNLCNSMQLFHYSPAK